MSEKRRTGLILLGLTLLAAVMRFWRLDQLPPGLWFDEGWVSVVARDWGNEVYFAASFGGMHPAVVYLTRLGRFFNASPLAIRYVLAAVGTLSIPLGFGAFRALFAQDPAEPPGRRLDPTTMALLAAAVLVAIYPFFHFSRLGFESMLPLPAALAAFWALAAALRPGADGKHPLWRRQEIILGLLLGLSIYSFDTGRFIPLAAAAAYWLVWLVHRPFPWRTAFWRFVTFTAIALLVGGPLLRYFWLHWEQFTARAAVTTAGTFGPDASPVPLALLRNLGRTLAGLSLPGFGDGIARHNLPGRPVFDPALSLLFWIGFVVALKNRARPAGLILLTWLAIGLLPVILTDGAPTYTRIFVAVPPLAALAAQGAGALYGWRPGRAAGLAILGLLLVGLGSTLYDYFGRWAVDPALFNDFQVGQWQGANLALALSRTEPVYFIPARPPLAEPAYDLLLAGSPVRAIPATPCLVLPPAGAAAVYLIDRRADGGAAAALEAIFPGIESQAAVRYPPTGETVFQRFDIPAGVTAALPGDVKTAVFGENILLVRWEMTGEELRFVWEAGPAPPTGATRFVHLYRAGEEDQPPLWQADGPPCYPTESWLAGERIVDPVVFDPPADLAPGRYTLALGWYIPPSFERLHLEAATGEILPDQRFWLLTIDIP